MVSGMVLFSHSCDSQASVISDVGVYTDPMLKLSCHGIILQLDGDAWKSSLKGFPSCHGVANNPTSGQVGANAVLGSVLVEGQFLVLEWKTVLFPKMGPKVQCFWPMSEQLKPMPSHCRKYSEWKPPVTTVLEFPLLMNRNSSLYLKYTHFNIL